MKTARDHNGKQWLEVRELQNGAHGGGFFTPGWYVVRTCPCHQGERVTLPLDSEATAQRAMQAMLAASQSLGT